MDSAAMARVTETARSNPESRTARTGFADRVLDYPLIPAWILWLYERNPSTAQFYGTSAAAASTTSRRSSGSLAEGI